MSSCCGERLGRAQGIAVALAAAGVSVLTLGYGRFPWISLALASTFGLYGLVRKTVAADAVTGLLCETAILTPAAAGYLLLLASHGTGAFGTDARATTVLLLGGAVTALPLALFAYGARAAAAVDPGLHPVPLAEPAVPARGRALRRAVHQRRTR